MSIVEEKLYKHLIVCFVKEKKNIIWVWNDSTGNKYDKSDFLPPARSAIEMAELFSGCRPSKITELDLR